VQIGLPLTCFPSNAASQWLKC